jgi:23S rRNA (adenine2503-C2)-methyltransferase
MEKINLCGLSPEEIMEVSGIPGLSLSTATIISNFIYKKRVNEISDIHGISKNLKQKLNAKFVCGLYGPESFRKSSDGSVKYLFRNKAGMLFETVFLPDNKRNTVCVSTQSGCRMGCPFCMTGRYGFHGNLEVTDIIAQILSIPDAGKVTNVVFMGMGEPLDNPGNVLRACKIITSSWGLALSPGNVTVSTVGITPAVKDFLEKSSCNLTFSLFSPFPDERVGVVPAERKYPASEIISLMKSYPIRKKRRMSVAYIMIKGVNDSDRHLDGLKYLLSGSLVRVNIIPYHPVPVDSNISSSPERMQQFRHELIINGISASVRKSRGIDVSAACGLLASGLK